MKYLNGIILSGGKSSRMGMEKGLLKIAGKALVEYAIDVLNPHVKRLIICSNKAEYNQFGLDVYSDLVRDIGPLGGIYTGLKYSDADCNIVLSCDMPFIDSQFIEYLKGSMRVGQTALVPTHDHKIEPLISIYTSKMMIYMEEYIQHKSYALQDILSNAEGVQFLDVSQQIKRNNKLFFNINSPAEWKQFKQIIK
ncbi:MAG: molybdenum cofactor guanylyltransferase [Bacteroidetes bacterium]|nr:molybdenum cofactor guanylyltransferase [Bacteroidota bacterium]